MTHWVVKVTISHLAMSDRIHGTSRPHPDVLHLQSFPLQCKGPLHPSGCPGQRPYSCSRTLLLFPCSLPHPSSNSARSSLKKHILDPTTSHYLLFHHPSAAATISRLDCHAGLSLVSRQTLLTPTVCFHPMSNYVQTLIRSYCCSQNPPKVYSGQQVPA